MGFSAHLDKHTFHCLKCGHRGNALDLWAAERSVQFRLDQHTAKFPGIFLWAKKSRGQTTTIWAIVKDLEEYYENGIRRIGSSITPSQFGKGKFRLTFGSNAALTTKMESAALRLGTSVNDLVFNGIKAGLKEAYIESPNDAISSPE